MDRAAGTRVLVDDKGRRHVERLRIEVRRGPAKGRSLDLDAEPIRIGTSEGCQVRLTDPTASGVHAELTRTPMGVLARDLGSTNGTFVEGRRVQGVYIDASTVVTVG